MHARLALMAPAPSIPGAQTPDPAAPAVRCVLLCPRALASPPADLTDSLQRRGVASLVCRSAYLALAELCAADRSTGARAPAALIVVEPSMSAPGDELDRVALAVERHAPGCSVWRYDRAASPPLRTVQPPRPVSAEPPPAPRSVPKLRLAPDTLHDLPAGNPDSSQPAPHAPILSDDELAMLLGDEFPPPASAPARDRP